MQYTQTDIEHLYYHQIQIFNLEGMYQLNVHLRSKPVIVGLHSLPVVKHVIDNSESLKHLLQLDHLKELKVSVPGFGIFNQKYELEQIANLFIILGEYGSKSYQSVGKIILEFPGWRTFSK